MAKLLEEPADYEALKHRHGDPAKGVGFLKKVAARTKDDLWDAIGLGIDLFTPTECQNYFTAAGYDRN